MGAGYVLEYIQINCVIFPYLPPHVYTLFYSFLCFLAGIFVQVRVHQEEDAGMTSFLEFYQFPFLVLGSSSIGPPALTYRGYTPMQLIAHTLLQTCPYP